jgi:hypothetical protein
VPIVGMAVGIVEKSHPQRHPSKRMYKEVGQYGERKARPTCRPEVPRIRCVVVSPMSGEEWPDRLICYPRSHSHLFDTARSILVVYNMSLPLPGHDIACYFRH